ncbi:MAG: NAD-dependent epimerase/dehydratase family protein, partial [Actinomycetota bacterium]|nr:NAD-dependent epimerase/dehydratase family protein [Actinomycetota bacterium]
MSSARVLVTGGFGFVGSQLCRTLVERGSDVAVLDDLSVGSIENLPEPVAADVRTIVADIRDLAAVERHVGEF